MIDYEKAKVYCLIDPRTDAVFYVGHTVCDLCVRLYGHTTEARKKPKTGIKNIKISEMLNEGHYPVIQLVEEVGFEQRLEREQYYIRKFISMGCELANQKAIQENPKVRNTPFDFSKMQRA